MSIELLGGVSGAVFCIATLPQIHKNWTTRSSKDISTPTIVLTYVGAITGIVYGAFIGHAAVYASNAVILALYMTLHGVKIRNERVAWEPLPCSSGSPQDR